MLDYLVNAINVLYPFVSCFKNFSFAAFQLLEFEVSTTLAPLPLSLARSRGLAYQRAVTSQGQDSSKLKRGSSHQD